jgi:hypothetical protein
LAEIRLYGRLGVGRFALVDDADLSLVSGYRWYLLPSGYAHAKPYLGNYRKGSVYMHRLILQPPAGMDTDHRNHDRLDNRRQNLRMATRSQNLANRSPRPGKFRGLKKERNAATWQARIKVNQRTICLGNFRTRIEAAQAYNEAARKHFGEFAVLNAV